MSEVKTIKGVDEDTWAEFKSLAAKENKNLGEVFEEMVKEYKEKKGKNFWKEFLTVKEPLSKEDGEEMQKLVKKMRREPGFRDIKWE